MNELWNSQGFLFKESHLFSDDQTARVLADPATKIFGLFSGHTLAATVGIKTWTQLPYFTLMNMVCRKEDRAIEAVRMLDHLFQYALTQMHAAGRFTFYFATLTKTHQLRHYAETGKVRHAKYFKSLEPYEAYVEEILAPGELSQHPTFVSICGGRSHPREIWIRRYSLIPSERRKYQTRSV